MIVESTFRCWKCGKEKPISEMSNICYTSNPPKYSCKVCEENITVEQNAKKLEIKSFLIL